MKRFTLLNISRISLRLHVLSGQMIRLGSCSSGTFELRSHGSYFTWCSLCRGSFRSKATLPQEHKVFCSWRRDRGFFSGERIGSADINFTTRLLLFLQKTRSRSPSKTHPQFYHHLAVSEMVWISLLQGGRCDMLYVMKFFY